MARSATKVAGKEVGQGIGYLAVPPTDVAPALALLLRDLPLARRTRVVDVGANPNMDDPPYLTLLRQGLCDVLGFEPNPAAFADLERIKGPRETYLPFAVGDGGAKELRLYRAQGFTSIFDPSEEAMRLIAMPRWFRLEQKLPLTTVALDKAEGVSRFDLLKIDIQGGEGDVFRGAERLLQTACAVIVEMRYFRLYDGEPMMAGIDRQLRELGFSLHRFLPMNSRPILNSQLGRLNMRRVREQVVDGDAVYVRDLARVDAMDDEQLIHLALLGASVIDSHTLVLYCLDQLAIRGVVPAGLAAAYVDALPAAYRNEAAPRPGDAP